jgi:hypothetical protein
MNDRKIKAELDDEAFKVADFIQELSKIQDQYFEALCKKAKDNNWMTGFKSEEDAEDWLFDYIFNGADVKSKQHEQTLSEYCRAEWL